ncbi:hypothetical protein TcCL_NonESM11426 [Trypanosoma cruzi]|nr:hypothetical protein TcCL_NonESM11426 [Trypanosoma cruzi]
MTVAVLSAHIHRLFIVSLCERLQQGIAAGVMGTTTASPLEEVPCTVGCGAARRFACRPTDNRTVVSLRSLHRHHPLRWCPQEPHLRTLGRSPLRIALAA